MTVTPRFSLKASCLCKRWDVIFQISYAWTTHLIQLQQLKYDSMSLERGIALLQRKISAPHWQLFKNPQCNLENFRRTLELHTVLAWIKKYGINCPIFFARPFFNRHVGKDIKKRKGAFPDAKTCACLNDQLCAILAILKHNVAPLSCTT